MKIVIIDNYDSFTYNLAHLVKELDAETDRCGTPSLQHPTPLPNGQDYK